ncbi:MAG: deoxyguanosinetriphosphate triphosphohydrolase family protein [Clostridia bacterium]|nr:putative dGTPase [Clostridium sp. CAG:389]
MKKFEKYATNPENPIWEKAIKRETPLYSRNNDIRNDFQRDYTRIIHSNAYRRLKHKTQVFFSPENDHICTRIEHVTHVESISYTIAKYLSLNTELTKAISVAHDIGHSPFGHQGEQILSEISKRDLNCSFWHEKNGLELVDNIELLEDNNKYMQNLDLTYAVRDGIISHCGEIDENCIRPREDYIDLKNYTFPNQYAPFTWEGCVVKISDKISYICRDIEDAITLGILDEHVDDLFALLNITSKNEPINNTIIINDLIRDLCENSSPENGLCFSNEALNLMNKIKEFNYKHIYLSKKLEPSRRYFSIVINEIYDLLKSTYDNVNTLNNLQVLSKTYPKLGNGFINFIYNYYDFGNRENLKLKNKILFSIDNKRDFYKAIIYYISGMTDNFAIEIYNEIIHF